MKNPIAIIGTAIGLLIGAALVGMNIGVNDAGYRTVIQYPNGTLDVKFDAGIYFPFFGKTEVWPDFLSKDFSAGEDNVCTFGQNDGVRVRYQDGGEGVVCGMVNVALPSDKDSMIAFHKRFRSEEGAQSKLLNQEFPKVLNLTAGLLKSEEAYATKRSEFISHANYQARNGLYRTKLVSKEVQVGVDEKGKPEFQTVDIPEILIGSNGQPLTQESIIGRWNLSVTQFDLKAWDFEAKTLKQISDKRDAEMAIITAKANANKAYYAEQQVIAEGKRAVAEMSYRTKTAAAKQIEEANRDKQLAVIVAEKEKERAIELTLAAKERTEQKRQEALAAVEEAKVITTLADAESYKVDRMQRAGELFRRIEAEVEMNGQMADAISQMNVPATMIVGGSSEGNGSTEMQQLLQLQVLDKLKTQQVASGK